MEQDKKIPACNAMHSVAGGKHHAVVETYAEDMAKVLENDTGGLIKKVIHGEEEHEEEKKNLSPESKKNEFFMFVGILCIVASVTTLFFFLSNKDAPSVVKKQFVPLIFTDQSTLVAVDNLKKTGVEEKVMSEINNTTVKVGGVEGIYLTLHNSIIGLRKFLGITDSNFIPGSSLVEDTFLLGVANTKTTILLPDQGNPVSPSSPLRDEPAVPTSKNFFILLKIHSIADIFDPIHAWENKMFSDLDGFLGIPLSPETKYLLTKNFEDGIIGNKNARILYDTNHTIVLMYVFADDNSVIITSSENAAREIMLRLASGRIKR